MRQLIKSLQKTIGTGFFFIRPAPSPKTSIEADPEFYLRAIMGSRSAGMKPFTDTAFNEYLRCLRLPGAATGICENYRAAAGTELEHDRAYIQENRQLACPLLVLWGAEGTVDRCFNPLSEWKKVAVNVQGKALSAGHYIAEEVPEKLIVEVNSFLT